MIPITVVEEQPYLKGRKELEKKKRWDVIKKLDTIIDKLTKHEITTQYHNHILTGNNNLKGLSELHVEGNLLLHYTYRNKGSELEILDLIDLSDHKEQKNTRHSKQIGKMLKSSYEIKETLQESNMEENKIYDAVQNHFKDSTYDGEFFELVASLVGRVDDYSDDEDIWSSIDEGLIYYKDQWTVLKYYCTPQEASWDEAFEELYSDIYSICQDLADEGAEDFDEDEVDEEEIEDLI